MEIPPKLKEYIDNNRGSLPPVTDPDDPLQIDSLGLIRLVAFLENDFGYRIEDEELSQVWTRQACVPSRGRRRYALVPLESVD